MSRPEAPTSATGAATSSEPIGLDPETQAAAERLRTGRLGYRVAKRAFDICFSAAALTALSPLMAVTAIAIKLDSPGPILFKQQRTTTDGRTFNMWKFRTMCVDAEDQIESLRHLNEKDGPVFKIKDDPRLTYVGRIIRRINLDELPQFLNVMIGDMSVVGPRPALPSEVELYEPWQRQRLLMKSGLTCYWQVAAKRDNVPFEDWVRMDMRYIRDCSIRTDLKLIVKTVEAVFSANGS